MRSLDLDLFNPIGIDEAKSRFIEALLLTCLLKDSPTISDLDHQVNNANQLAVANLGRKPGLQLDRGNEKILLTDWASEILETMRPVCEILDQGDDNKPYTAALAKQQALVEDPGLTASARILASLSETQLPFSRYAIKKSEEHAQYFRQASLEDKLSQEFTQMAASSLSKQKELESKVQIPFDEFLKRYFSQT
jgi:glutamate--cysteine ligase